MIQRYVRTCTCMHCSRKCASLKICPSKAENVWPNIASCSLFLTLWACTYKWGLSSAGVRLVLSMSEACPQQEWGLSSAWVRLVLSRSEISHVRSENCLCQLTTPAFKYTSMHAWSQVLLWHAKYNMGSTRNTSVANCGPEHMWHALIILYMFNEWPLLCPVRFKLSSIYYTGQIFKEFESECYSRLPLVNSGCPLKSVQNSWTCISVHGISPLGTVWLVIGKDTMYACM